MAAAKFAKIYVSVVEAEKLLEFNTFVTIEKFSWQLSFTFAAISHTLGNKTQSVYKHRANRLNKWCSLVYFLSGRT